MAEAMESIKATLRGHVETFNNIHDRYRELNEELKQLKAAKKEISDIIISMLKELGIETATIQERTLTIREKKSYSSIKKEDWISRLKTKTNLEADEAENLVNEAFVERSSKKIEHLQVT